MDTGSQRTVVLAVGHPAGWIADQLPLGRRRRQRDGIAVARRGPVGRAGGFNSAPVAGGAGAGSRRGAATPITTDAFDRAELGAQAGQACPR